MIQRLTTWLIYLTLFLLPWQTRYIFHEGSINNGPSEYGSISLYIITLLILITLILFIISQKGFQLHFNGFTHQYIVSAFLLYLIILIPLSLSHFLSLYKVIILCCGIILIYILSEIKISFRLASLSLIMGAVMSGLLGIWQFLTQSTFANKWLGLASHEANALGTSVIEAVATDGFTERWLRAYGSLDHPNMFGGFMALTLILASWLWLFRKNAENKIEGTLLILSIAILSAATIVSFSRTAWLAASAGIITLGITYLQAKKNNWADLMAWLGAIGIVTVLITSQYSYLFSPRLSGDSRLEQISTNERLDGFTSGISLLKKNLLFGSGIGTYSLDLEKMTPKKPSWYYQPVHNTFLLISVEIGLLGLLLLLATIATFLQHIYKRSSGINRGLLIALSLSGIIIALFDHWLFSLHFGIMVSATLLGLMTTLPKSSLLTE